MVLDCIHFLRWEGTTVPQGKSLHTNYVLPTVTYICWGHPVLSKMIYLSPPAFWQAKFWSFCTEQWDGQSIHEDNVDAEALRAATAYLAHLRACGELPPLAN